MNQNTQKHVRSHVYMLLGMLEGFICFLLMYGTKTLDVTYDAFLINQGADLSQNYFGWVFYRFASGGQGMGMMDTLTYPNRISLIYTDSIPIIELILKPFAKILPEVFQYWGWYGAICFALSGGIAALIIKRWTEKIYLVGIAVIPFILASPVMLKMWYHHTFVAQWILLLAFCIWLYHKDKWDILHWKNVVFTWFCMGILAGSIHFYFVPMVGIILVGYVLQMFLENSAKWRLSIGTVLAYCSGALLFMTAFGLNFIRVILILTNTYIC